MYTLGEFEGFVVQRRKPLCLFQHLFYFVYNTYTKWVHSNEQQCFMRMCMKMFSDD